MTNAEKFRTVKERYHAFRKTFGTKCEDCKCMPQCSCDLSECIIRWLDMEAEEEKIENCPYCGGSCLVSNGAVGKYRVFCEKNLSCMYSSGAYTTEHEAIAAHNRMARAVMEDENKEGK